MSVLQSDLDFEDFLAGLAPEVVLLDWQREVLRRELGARWLDELLERAEPTPEPAIDPAGITLERALAIAEASLAHQVADGTDPRTWEDA